MTILLHVETERDVTLKIDLPYLFDTDDIKVDFGEDGFRLEVEDYLSFSRRYWQPRYILDPSHDHITVLLIKSLGQLECPL